MSLVPSRFLDAVVAVGFKKESNIFWNGTGFFYIHKNMKDQYYLFLVTNSHVITNIIENENTNIFLKLNSTKYNESIDFELDLIDDDLPLYMCHPDKNVDICVIDINYSELKDKVDIAAILSDKNALTIEELKNEEVFEGDEVFVLGFPMGNVGIKRKSTIVRKGCIARISDVIMHENNEFLLDALIFPGNSGGPVILKPELTSLEGTKSHMEACLIGIVNAYIPYEEIAKSEQTGYNRVIFTENSGLASAHPVDLINETIEVYYKGKK